MGQNVYGDARSEKRQLVDLWLSDKEAERENARQEASSALAREANDIARAANKLASDANDIAAIASRRARTANAIAIIAALIAIASVAISYLDFRDAILQPDPSASPASSSQP